MKLANLAVTTAKLADLNVTTGKIAASAVDASKLAVDAVTESKIAAGAVTNLKIAAGTIAFDRLASDAVRDSNIANLTISAGKLAGSIPYSKLSLSAGEVPADRIGAIPGSQITANTITGTQLLDGTVTATELADSAVTTAKLDAGAVVTSKIGDAQVTPQKLSQRAKRERFYPTYPNSYLRVDDLDTQIQLNMVRLTGSAFDDAIYTYTNNSATAGVKSGFIVMKANLGLDFVSMTNIYLIHKVTGTGSVIVRCYDSLNALSATSAVGTSTTFVNVLLNTFSGTFSAGLITTIEIECRAAPGDTVSIQALRLETNVQ